MLVAQESILRLNATAIDYLIIALYFTFVLGIGYLAKRAVSTSLDFFLSGRSLPAWVTGLAFISANLGGEQRRHQPAGPGRQFHRCRSGLCGRRPAQCGDQSDDDAQAGVRTEGAGLLADPEGDPDRGGWQGRRRLVPQADPAGRLALALTIALNIVFA